ncbi:MAG: cysteine--tRNA ligase [Candidatus Shapirobacteria bacterium]
MSIKVNLYNTAIRLKEEFKPITEGKVGIYSCGPTVYWSPHVGNMYAYLFNDILVRSLRYLGYEVKRVMNITDVGELASSGEDKMEKGAIREGISVWDVAKKYEQEFFESSEALNIEKPEVVCRATEYIKEQIDLIKRIESNGFTYVIDDGVYFDTSKFVDYAKFARLKLDEQIDTDRDDISRQKRNKSDFALWKFSPKDRKREMEWDSPWGKGFPGWHIECTAMSVKNLGEVFDIHTGGIDHIPIHHSNEIAQGFGAFGHQTANYWIHNGFLTGPGGRKISKSEGGLYTVAQLIEMGYDPLWYRYQFLTSHYRKGIEFSLDSLKSSQVALNKLREKINQWPDGGVVNETYKSQFIEKLADDLATPEALALVWKLVKDETVSHEDRKATILDFDRVLGLKLDQYNYSIKEEVPEEIETLMEARTKARSEKNWAESDRLRDEIKSKGWEVEDTPQGPKANKLTD